VPWDPAQSLGDLQPVQDVQNGGSTRFICMMVRCVHPGQITAFSNQKKRIKLTHANMLGSTNYPYKFDMQDFFISYETQVRQGVVFPAIFK
jgi:hypothetical protein